MLHKLLSYIIPVKIFKVKSKISKTIEIAWVNGELVMDSENTNYSYGSLQRILRRGLRHIGFDTVAKMNQVLVLGIGGGSVIKTLVNEIHFEGQITGVDIDAEVIQIANKFFELDKIQNLKIIIDDAFDFVLKAKDRYDLIIIDIFQDMNMPNFLFEQYFFNRLTLLLQSKGYILFNTMSLTEEHRLRNQNFIRELSMEQLKIISIPKVEIHNELIILENHA